MGRWPTWKQKALLFEAAGYAPTEIQIPAHQSTARVIQVVGAERAGKSRWTGMEIFARLPWSDRVAIVADEYDEARAEWQYVADALAAVGGLERTSTPRYGQWWGRARTGCEFMTISVHTGIDELTGTGKPFDVVALVEAGLIGYNTFLAARGRVTETRGVILMSGTLWDNVGWYADLYRSFQGANKFDGASFSLPAWGNRAIFPGGKADPEILAWRATLDAEEAARRIDAQVLPSPARIYPDFSHVLHVQPWVSFDPQGDVVLFVDAGYYPSRYAVLAAQFRQDEHGREVLCIVDEIWEHHRFHEEIVKMARAKPWANNVVQAVGGHETKQHQAQESTAEVWEAAWPGLYFETFNAGRVLEGVRRVRWLLSPPGDHGPRLFLSSKCSGTAWEFGHYKRKTNRKGEVISEDPEDRPSQQGHADAMDALRNGVVWRYGLVPEAPAGEGRESNNSWENPYG